MAEVISPKYRFISAQRRDKEAQKILDLILNPNPDSRRKNKGRPRKEADFGFGPFNLPMICGKLTIRDKDGNEYISVITIKREAKVPEENELFISTFYDYKVRRFIISDSYYGRVVLRINLGKVKEAEYVKIARLILAHAIHGKAFKPPKPRRHW